MPTQDAIAAIMDFERVFEMALKQMLCEVEIKAFTSQLVPKTGDPAGDKALTDQGYDLLDYQKDRPRVEIMFLPGAGAGRWNNKVIAGIEVPVETSWKGQYKLDLITGPDMRLHSSFRTQVRYQMIGKLLGMNGNQLTMHNLHTFYHDSGTSPVVTPEQGVFQTTMLWDIDFSIQDDAWTTLTN